MSVAAWCLGVGGHSGDSDNASSSDSDARKSHCQGGATLQRCVIDGARVYAADNAGTGADAEQARMWAAL